MINAATGLSTLSDSIHAALEASRTAVAKLDGQRPDWCVAFVTAEHANRIDELVRTISETAGTPYVVGCSAAGVMADAREVEAGPTVGVLAVSSDRIRATPFLFLDDGDQGLTAGVRVGQRLMASRNSKDLVLVWPDPVHVRPDRLLQGLDATLGKVPVAGAAASARAHEATTFQFSGAETGRGAVSGIRLGGDFRFRVAVTQGCRPLGQPLTVTRSHENLILEVEGRPALEVMRERAPVAVLNDPTWAHHSIFVGLVPEGDSGDAETCDYLVRNVVTADDDTGVLAIADTVEEGQRIVFALREADSARADLARTLRRMRAEAGEVNFRFGFYFNCLARGRSLYKEEGVDAALLGNALPGVPLLGLFGNAEIAPLRGGNRVLTYTGVLILVSD